MRFFIIFIFCSTFIGCSCTPCRPFANFTYKWRKKTLNEQITLTNLQDVHAAKMKIHQALKVLQYDKNKDYLVLFVHGKGDHPNKSYNKILPYLEGQYRNVKVLLFHWPAPVLAPFPKGKALAAKDSLKIGIEALKEVKKSGKINSCVLFTNSMGSFVLQSLTQEGYILPDDLFSNVLLNASASPLSGHKIWVDKLNCSNIYITFNKDDFVLHGASIVDFGARLGVKLKHLSWYILWLWSFTPEPLSEKAVYVDFSYADLVGRQHKYYVNGKMINQCNSLSIHNFYYTILQGKKVNLDNRKYFKKRERNIYEIKIPCRKNL